MSACARCKRARSRLRRRSYGTGSQSITGRGGRGLAGSGRRSTATGSAKPTGHGHDPPPGLCGQAYAEQVHGHARARWPVSPLKNRSRRSRRVGMGPRWWRPWCTAHLWSVLSQVAQPRHGRPSARRAVHRRRFSYLGLRVIALRSDNRSTTRDLGRAVQPGPRGNGSQSRDLFRTHGPFCWG